MKTNTNGTHNPKMVHVETKGVLFQGDSLLLLKEMVSDSIDLVFVDPPFNLGKDYKTDSFDDQIAIEAYRQWYRTWLMELIRVLRPGGTLFLYHWPKWLMEIGAWLNTLPTIEYRSWIALKMKSGFPIRGRLHPAHYGIIYYTKKGGQPTFNVVRQKTPICRHCGREVRDYGGYRKKFEKFEDEEGIPWIQISDFWEDTRPARQDKSRDIQINELPLHIPERAILLASNPGDVVLDIFGGGGSTFQAAQANDRYWIGCELGNVEPIISRLKTFFDYNKVDSVPDKLKENFRGDFIEKQLQAYVSGKYYERWLALAGLNGASSQPVYQSKTRDLGF